MYRVLLVEPDNSIRINQTNEEEWITRSFQTEILGGDKATAEGLYEFIVGRKFDILHFAAHGDETGVLLSGGSKLTMYDIERIARIVGAKLVYLNSCASARLAQFAVDHGVPAVIANTADVSDAQAWSTAINFYHALLTHGDFYNAYEAAKPHDGSLSFFSSSGFARQQMHALLDDMKEIRSCILRLSYLLVATWIVMLLGFAMVWWRVGQ